MIKKGLMLLLGLLIEGLVLWGLYQSSGRALSWEKWCRLLKNPSVYILFAVGFATAHWLILWSKILARLHNKKQPHETPVSPISNAVTTAPVTTPVQEEQIDTPTMAPEPSVPTQEVNPPGSTSPTAQPARVTPPIKMAVQNNAILNVAPMNTAPAATPATPSTPTPASTTAAPVATAAPSSSISQKDKDIATLADIDPDLDMMAFKHVALEGKIIDLVYSSDDVAVLCKIFSEPHTWTVNMNQPLEECTWTDEAGNSIQPCKNLMLQVAALKKMEPTALIVPTLVMIRGLVQNYQEVVDYLLQNRINLVQYENNSMPELKDLHQLLKDKFSLFPGEEEIWNEKEPEDTPQEDTQDG